MCYYYTRAYINKPYWWPNRSGLTAFTHLLFRTLGGVSCFMSQMTGGVKFSSLVFCYTLSRQHLWLYRYNYNQFNVLNVVIWWRHGKGVDMVDYISSYFKWNPYVAWATYIYITWNGSPLISGVYSSSMYNSSGKVKCINIYYIWRTDRHNIFICHKLQTWWLLTNSHLNNLHINI